MLSKEEKGSLRKNINKTNQEIYILSLDEMNHVINKKVKGNNLKSNWASLKSKIEFSASYYASGGDIVLLGRLMSDLGYAGTQAYIKYYGGKPHIILKGRPGLRSILTATKYGVKNTKIVKMGIGKHGAVRAARMGGVITIALVTTYRVIDFFLTDTATLNQLVGTLATDVVKIGIATGASIAAASGVAAAGFLVAIGPLVAAIVVGVAVSWLLGELDQHYNVTEKVIAGLDELSDSIENIIEAKKQEVKNIADDVVEAAIDYTLNFAKK